MAARLVIGVCVMLAGVGCAPSGDVTAPTPPVPPGPGIEAVRDVVAVAESTVAAWSPQNPASPATEVDYSDVVRVSTAEISPDATTVTVHFTGAGGPASEPCGADYTGHPVVGPLAATVVVAEYDSPTGEACPAVGYLRSVEVTLPEPLGQRTLIDLEGSPVQFTTAPPGELPEDPPQEPRGGPGG